MKPETRQYFRNFCHSFSDEGEHQIMISKTVAHIEDGKDMTVELELTIGSGYFSGSMIHAVGTGYEKQEFDRLITRPLDEGIEMFLNGRVPLKDDQWVKDVDSCKNINE